MNRETLRERTKGLMADLDDGLPIEEYIANKTHAEDVAIEMTSDEFGHDAVMAWVHKGEVGWDETNLGLRIEKAYQANSYAVLAELYMSLAMRYFESAIAWRNGVLDVNQIIEQGEAPCLIGRKTDALEVEGEDQSCLD